MTELTPVHAGRLCASEPLDPWWLCCGRLGHESNRVVAQRLRDWAYAWVRRTARPGGESIETTAMFIGTLAEHARHLRNHLSEDEDERIFELRALLVAASAVRTIDPDGSLLRFAVGELQATARSW